MKRWIEQIRRLMLVLCCTTLSLLNTHARAETVDTSAKAAVLIERSTGNILLCVN